MEKLINSLEIFNFTKNYFIYYLFHYVSYYKRLHFGWLLITIEFFINFEKIIIFNLNSLSNFLFIYIKVY